MCLALSLSTSLPRAIASLCTWLHTCARRKRGDINDRGLSANNNATIVSAGLLVGRPKYTTALQGVWVCVCVRACVCAHNNANA